MFKDPELRKLAGLPADVPSRLREDKEDVITSELFQYLEKCLRGEIAESTSPQWGSAISCLDTLKKRGYAETDLAAMRTFFESALAADAARSAARKAMTALRSQRWDKSEVY